MAKKRKNVHDLVIIGGGVGGLVTASVAGQLGLDLVLIEREPALGGDCLHYGCVPSKTLIRSAEIAHLARTAARFGVQAETHPTDLGRGMSRLHEVVERIQVNDDPARFREYGVDVRFGPARFADPHTVALGDGVVQGRRFVLATGSSPAIPPSEGLEAAGYLTNRTVFGLQRLPERLAVLGGGPVGVELAQAFARLGSEVALIEMADRLLAREDAELAVELTEVLRAEGMRVRTQTAVQSVQIRAGDKMLGCSGPEGAYEVAVDEILVATGRQPNVADLALENAGVEYGRAGIGVDARMRTSARHIYACGDCCGPLPLMHAAEYQAGIVLANAVFRWPKKADYGVIPWATYTDPELAQVGLIESAARERGFHVQVARFPFEHVDRALTEGRESGQAKLVVHRGRLVGASILGPHAGELIHEAAMAIRTRARIGTIAGMVQAYPTLSQVHRRAVNSLYGPRLFSSRTRTAVRWPRRRREAPTVRCNPCTGSRPGDAPRSRGPRRARMDRHHPNGVTRSAGHLLGSASRVCRHDRRPARVRTFSCRWQVSRPPQPSEADVLVAMTARSDAAWISPVVKRRARAESVEYGLPRGACARAPRTGLDPRTRLQGVAHGLA